MVLQVLGYTGADIARRLGGGFMASCGAEGEGGCGVCEARECQGRGAAAVQGGWHAIESYGLLTESPLLLRCYKSEQLKSEQRKACNSRRL